MGIKAPHSSLGGPSDWWQVSTVETLVTTTFSLKPHLKLPHHKLNLFSPKISLSSLLNPQKTLCNRASLSLTSSSEKRVAGGRQRRRLPNLMVVQPHETLPYLKWTFWVRIRAQIFQQKAPLVQIWGFNRNPNVTNKPTTTRVSSKEKMDWRTTTAMWKEEEYKKRKYHLGVTPTAANTANPGRWRSLVQCLSPSPPSIFVFFVMIVWICWLFHFCDDFYDLLDFSFAMCLGVLNKIILD